MVTATTGTATFLGQSGALYTPSFYIADVIGTDIKWSQEGIATSSSPSYVQFSEPVKLIDVSIITGPTVMKALIMTSGGASIPGKLVSVADHLTTIQSRVPVNLPFAAKSLIGAREV